MYTDDYKSDYADIEADINNLLTDYIEFRKRLTKNTGNIAVNGCSNNVQYFENYEYDYNFDMPDSYHCLEKDDVKKQEDKIKYNDFINYTDEFMDEDYSRLTAAEYDNEYIKNLRCSISRRIHPIIEKVLDSYECHCSPIFEDYIDRESLAQIVDKVILIAQNDIAEVEEMILESENNYWERYSLLQALIEALLLHDIYFIRRPRNKKLRKYM